MNRVLYLLFIVFFPFMVAGQQHADRIIPLGTNPVLTEISKKKASERITPPPPIIKLIKLPFLDDFSKPSPFPDTNLWINGGVFTNYTYPVYPRTLGVATFDGVDGAGLPYDPLAGVNASNPADTLTSQFIAMAKYTPVDSIYLSFYWQSGGLGSYPKTNDSLILEFSDGATWNRVWYHLGYIPSSTEDSGFHFVNIRVDSSIYFINGFQFRFRSYACTSGNLDHWNIDLVYMNLIRSYDDSIEQDIAFTRESPAIIKKYTAMPWEQFTANDIQDTNIIIERNNYNAVKNSVVTETISGLTNLNYTSGNFNFQPSIGAEGYNPYHLAEYIPCNFTYTALTSPATWNVLYTMNTTNDFDNWNDTLRYAQVFDHYYAYDDGTAEASYSIINVNTPPTELATQIKLNHPDTLLGIYLFFNYVVSDARPYIFRLAAWSDNGGQPSNTPLLEAAHLYSPAYDSLNHYAYYKLDTPVVVSGTVYIGFIQTVGDTMNIGYDWNDNAQYQTFYNAGFGWNYSSFTGAPMMRPVFGKTILNDVSSVIDGKQSLTLYPNPARDEVKFSETIESPTTIKIYASDGRLCFENEHFTGNTINTSELPNGFYIVQVLPENSKPAFQKLIISR